MPMNDPAAYQQMPAALQRIMNLDAPPNAGVPAQLPRFEAGGYVGQGSMPQGPAPAAGMQTQAPQQLSAQGMEQEIQQFIAQNPQAVEQIKQVLVQGLQSGEITPQELNQITQMVQAVAQNPDMYPAMRRYAIAQGIVGPNDLPEQYDQGVVFTVLLAARALQQEQGPQGQTIPSMAVGGPVAGPQAGAPVVAEVHEGEYVVPKRVVEMKGREFFDNLVSKYAEDGQ